MEAKNLLAAPFRKAQNSWALVSRAPFPDDVIADEATDALPMEE
jgi:hypothetical protein